VLCHVLTPVQSPAERIDVVQLGNCCCVRFFRAGAAVLQVALKIVQVLRDFLGEI
jgi:hypothetical protein